LANRIVGLAPKGLDHVFFCNSGSEAVDTALKVALAYHATKGDAARTRLIGRERGYHGVGFGGISVGGMVNNRKLFGSLLAGVDTIFANSDTSKPRRSLHSTRAFAIFQRIEAHLREDLKSPIYSNALAEAVGVSIRTLQDVILQYRGMSLHRYLRFKRLWLVRKRLTAGGISVKACALEYGFWHLSDFSRSYHLHFGETPSQTLARAR